MKDFNTDLKALFKNFVDNKTENKYKNDIEEKLLKKENLFDFNADNKVDKKDLMSALSDGLDIDGDGKINENEKKFVISSLIKFLLHRQMSNLPFQS